MSAENDLDEQLMRRALRLAMNGRGRVEPNPMVGSVIAKNDQIIGEGWHKEFGGPHAEPNALADCLARGSDPRGATAYITLEPCCHTTKKTPPCAPALIQAGIKRAVIGCVDPYHEVNGGGIAQLQKAGIQVDHSSLEAQARQLITRFTAHIARARPYVTLKWAQSADRKVAGSGGQRLQISNAASRDLIHELRSRVDGILVGVNTILADDPLLSARYARQPRHPARFVLDRNLRTPITAQVIQHRSAPTTIFCGYRDDGEFRHRRDALQNQDVTVTLVHLNEQRQLDLDNVLARVRDAFKDEILVEPGPTLARSFLNSQLVDRVWIVQSPTRVGEQSAPDAPDLPGDYVRTGQLDLDGDSLEEYLNPHSPFFYSSTPSADFILASSSESSS
jgi:diaminohydroxyphosphoribosylaminopyrimidine deaminase/5-amino-6-(5-phosphoribosylamino)uracil reductase